MRFPARYFGRATGRHRAPRVPGQLAQQEFVHCPTCKTTCAATRHGEALLCTEGGHLIGGEA